MANKKKIEERLKAQQSKQTERAVQIVGGSVLALVVIGLIWVFFNNRSNSETTIPPVDLGPTQEIPAAVEEPAASSKQYDAPPPMTIDTSKKYTATFKMAKGGEFVVELYADKSPITVNSFVFLARDHYFDGVTFHRVLEGFMAQGGDPTGTGRGGPGYQFVNEDSDLKFDKPGVLAMANAGRDTNGSQFFITFDATPQLDGGYTIFGQVVSGMDVVNGITRRDPNQYPDYTGDVIETIEITEE
jgi:cyclophilin family peptidyl-prolyl cis-trans isomerase